MIHVQRLESATTEHVDWRGIGAFLAITFGLTYSVEGLAIAGGLRFDTAAQPLSGLLVAGVMWVPALGALLTLRLVCHEPWQTLRLRLGPWRPYLVNALVLPLCFVLVYALTWLLGLGAPDWQLEELRAIAASGGADPTTMPAPGLILAALAVASLVVAPLFNMLFTLGEEIGWRGFLLPRLLPLGQPAAHLLLGLIWGLWHLPLVLTGFTYPGHPLAGALLFLVLTTALGTYINVQWMLHQSTLLAAWVHAIFNAQKLGLWFALFPVVYPLLGGYAGLVGLAVWCALALSLWAAARLGRP